MLLCLTIFFTFLTNENLNIYIKTPAPIVHALTTDLNATGSGSGTPRATPEEIQKGARPDSDVGRQGSYELYGLTLEGTLTEMLAPFFLRIISFLFALVGLLAILGIVYSSYILVTSGGNEQAIQTGKKGVTNAIVGLAVALCGYVIIYTIQYLLGI